MVESVLVIACGDPLLEDGGVAWHILEGLRMLRPRRGMPTLHLRHADPLTSDLAPAVSRAAGVVFLGARRGGPPGELSCEPIAPAAGQNPLTEALTPQGLLLYAEGLYGRAPQATLITIEGERFGAGDHLSPVVRRAAPWAIRAVVRQARTWAATRGEMPTVV